MNKLSKYISSFFKEDWHLQDYPISYTRPNPDNVKAGLVSGDMWIASVDGWPGMSEMSNSKESALQALESTFQNYVNSGAKLPRPGTKKKLEMASTEGIDRHYEIFRSFCQDILNHNPDSVFVSDESSLWDFSEASSLDAYFKKISDRYGIDVSQIKDGNILEILRNIDV